MTAITSERNMSDGAGQPPVVIVPEQTTITSGTAVQEKLITAARVFSDLLKPTFGPRGLDKMLYKTNGTTAVTNDGAKIVAELLVESTVELAPASGELTVKIISSIASSSLSSTPVITMLALD